MEEICDDLQLLANFTGPFLSETMGTIQYTPSGPVPGVIFGLVQQDAILLEFCQTVKAFQAMKGDEKALSILEYGNRLTGSKYDRGIQQIRDTYSFYQATSNFFDDSRNKNIARATVYANQINSFVGRTQEYYDSVTGMRGDIFITRAEREQRMSELVSTSRELARITDDLRCTKKSEANAEEIENFNIDMPPVEERVRFHENQVEWLKNEIDMFAIKFVNGIEEHKVFNTMLLKAFNQTHNYRETIRKRPRSYTKTLDSGREVEREELVDYQVFSIESNPIHFNRLISTYATKWDQFITRQYTSGEYGLLESRKDVQTELADPSFRCQYNRLKNYINKEEGLVDEYTDEFRLALQRTRINCQSGAILNFEGNNLFTYYVTELDRELKLYKQALAEKWTLESYYFGINRVLTNQDSRIGDVIVSQQDVKCDKEKNEARVLELKAKAQMLTTRQRAILLEQTTLKNVLRENDMQREIREKEEYQRRRKLEDEIQKRKGFNTDTTNIPLRDVDRGF